MKVVMISGSHPRHLYIAKKLLESGFLAGIVIQAREPMIEEPTVAMSSEIRRLYDHHFSLRAAMEDKYFGNVNISNILNNVPCIDVLPAELNSKKTVDFIKSISADTLISYGPDLIHDDILNLCKDRAFNIHGGLSPYYKGAATMFWPFYFLEPNYVGTTIHHITSKIDAGNIIHQCVPVLQHGDGMHEVACKAMVETGNDLKKLLSLLSRENTIEGEPQRKNGKLFLNKDWRPEHLKLIYDVYEDKIVDYYLDGKINQNNNPKLVRAF